VASVAGDLSIDCEGLETRDVNRTIKAAIAEGATEIHVRNPVGRHAFAVALDTDGVHIVFEGPTGWYTAGMNGGPHVEIRGNVGWGLAECMMSGRVDVHGHAGSGTAASIRGGSVFIAGDAGARAGIAMKGGALVVGGDVGYMTGFMMQMGTIVACGDAADGLGDSMYEGTIYVGGSITSRGADAEIEDMTDDDVAAIRDLLAPHGLEPDPAGFTKVRSGRKLWNFSTKEPELWKAAL
jgi:glutamate synthase domain-containing protein 3